MLVMDEGEVGCAGFFQRGAPFVLHWSFRRVLLPVPFRTACCTEGVALGFLLDLARTFALPFGEIAPIKAAVRARFPYRRPP